MQLVASVRSIGVIEPVVVVPLGHRANGHRYQLVAGFRRYSAACAAGLSQIPAIVRRGLTDEQVLEIRLVENLQRLDMNPIEEARAVKELLEKARVSQDQLGRRIGRSGAWVSLRLGMLTLPEDVQDKVASGKLSVVHANALIPFANRDAALLRRAVAAAEQMGFGPWRTELQRLMSELPRSFPARRDLCTCTCSCCTSARVAGPHLAGVREERVR